MKSDRFIESGRAIELTERATAQAHFIDLSTGPVRYKGELPLSTVSLPAWSKTITK
jgi:hypothetical protein